MGGDLSTTVQTATHIPPTARSQGTRPRRARGTEFHLGLGGLRQAEPSSRPCWSSLPDISPSICRLAPRRAVDPAGAAATGRAASVLMTLPSTVAEVGLVEFVSGAFDGAGTAAGGESGSAFLFPHIGPPRSFHGWPEGSGVLDRGDTL